MPTYTYYCSICGDMDIKQSIYDQPLLSCPDCGTSGITKRFHAAGISFKGKGFYSTDSKKG